MQAYVDYLAAGATKKPGNNYDDNLNALAAGLVGGVIASNGRQIVTTLKSSKPLLALWDKAYQQNLEKLTDKVHAYSRTRKELTARMGDVFAKDSLDGPRLTEFARAHWHLMEAPTPLKSGPTPRGGSEQQFEDKLNALAHGLAMGMKNGEIGATLGNDLRLAQLYYDLVLYQRYHSSDSSDTMEKVERALLDRLPNVYKDSPPWERQQFGWKVQAYWNNRGGWQEAERIGMLAELQYARENDN